MATVPAVSDETVRLMHGVNDVDSEQAAHGAPTMHTNNATTLPPGTCANANIATRMRPDG